VRQKADRPAHARAGTRSHLEARISTQTTHSRHDKPIVANRLKALPEPPKRPDEVSSADITYLPSQQEGWLYLDGELDLYSRRLVGWKLGTSLSAGVARQLPLTETTTGYMSCEIASMPNISIRSHATIDYVTGVLLILLPFAVPYLDNPDKMIGR
jgi:transposase InsO family protein